MEREELVKKMVSGFAQSDAGADILSDMSFMGAAKEGSGEEFNEAMSAALSAIEAAGMVVVPRDLGADYIYEIDANGKREPVHELRGRVRDVYRTLIDAATAT